MCSFHTEKGSCYGLLHYETVQFGKETPKFWSYILFHCILKMEAVDFFEMLVPPTPTPTAWSHNPVSISVHIHKIMSQFNNNNKQLSRNRNV